MTIATELATRRIAALRDINAALLNAAEVIAEADLPFPTAAWGACRAVRDAALGASVTVEFEIRRLEEEVPRG